MNFGRLYLEEISPIPDRNFFASEMALWVHRSIRLRDEKTLFAITGEIIDLIGNTSLLDFAIGRFNESKLVDTRKSTHRTNQPDVRSFWRLNRANPTVVRWMD